MSLVYCQSPHKSKCSQRSGLGKLTKITFHSIFKLFLRLNFHSGLSLTFTKSLCLMRINAGNLLFELYELFVNSIENSNKSKMLSKRLRYLSDHLTFNCFTQVVKPFSSIALSFFFFR